VYLFELFIRAQKKRINQEGTIDEWNEPKQLAFGCAQTKAWKQAC
jgi:hypothetical protein